MAQRESEEMTKARTRERLQTRLEAEKTKKLVCTHTHTQVFFPYLKALLSYSGRFPPSPPQRVREYTSEAKSLSR